MMVLNCYTKLTNAWNYPLKAILPFKIYIEDTHTFSKKNHNIYLLVANNVTRIFTVAILFTKILIIAMFAVGKILGNYINDNQ